MGMTPTEAGKLGYKKARRKILLFIKSKIQDAKEKYSTKKCLHCKKLLSYEKRYNTYCTQSCAAKERNAGRFTPRPCETCGIPLKCTQRKCCSWACTNKRRQKEFVGKWLRGEASGGTERFVSSRVRRWLIETRGEKCEECGWAVRHSITGKVPVQVDHKDGNAKNNRPENLALLCPNCHSLTPTFGGLNRGHGRSWRSYQWKKTPV
jgi:hypothetical protein